MDIRICTALLSFVFFLPATGLAAKKTVLNITSYHSGFFWTAECEAGIRSVLEDEYKVVTHYLDTNRVSGEQFQARADKAWDFHRKIRPDLVMLGDDNALKLLGPKLAAARVPVVFYGINGNPREYLSGRLPSNFTGLLERRLVMRAIRAIQSVLPEMSKVMVVLDGSHTADIMVDFVFQHRNRVLLEDVQVGYANHDDWTEWRKTILNEDGEHDMLLLSNYFTMRGPDGGNISPEAALEWAVAHSPVPVFALQDSSVHSGGTVGAYVVEGKRHGIKAGLIAKRILSGVPPSPIVPAADKEGILYLSRGQLERHDLTVPESVARKSVFKE